MLPELVIQLLLLRGTHRAHGSAGTALDALIRIDYILAVAFRNRIHGAAFGAASAGDAAVIDHICHTKTLQ